MNILIAQDGFERVLCDRLNLSIDFYVEVYHHRRSYSYYARILLYISIKLVGGFLNKKRCTIYYSSNEADEFLCYVLILCNLIQADVKFIRIKLNDREASFVESGDNSSIPPRLLKIYRFFYSFLDFRITGILNDIGAKSFLIEFDSDCYTFDLNKSSYARNVKRVIVLLEPLRSDTVMDIERWNEVILLFIKNAVAKYGELPVYKKAHPYQPCLEFESSGVSEIPRNHNIFEILNDSDLIVGTFGSVIDVAPCICRTYSLVSRLNVKDGEIIKRVQSSGAKLV